MLPYMTKLNIEQRALGMSIQLCFLSFWEGTGGGQEMSE